MSETLNDEQLAELLADADDLDWLEPKMCAWIVSAVTELLALRKRVEWQDIKTAPDDGDFLALDMRTGAVGISSVHDSYRRRGIHHRNGFPATHWAAIPASLPTPKAPS